MTSRNFWYFWPPSSLFLLLRLMLNLMRLTNYIELLACFKLQFDIPFQTSRSISKILYLLYLIQFSLPEESVAYNCDHYWMKWESVKPEMKRWKIIQINKSLLTIFRHIHTFWQVEMKFRDSRSNNLSRFFQPQSCVRSGRLWQHVEIKPFLQNLKSTHRKPFYTICF